MTKRILAVLLLMFAALFASGQSFVTVTAANIHNGSSGLLPSGTIAFQAVGTNGQAISYQVGGGGQQILYPTVCTVNNGAITGAACLVANVALTIPQNLCFNVTVKNTAGQVVLGGTNSGYQCVQPTTNNSWCTASTCNFDTFAPNLPSTVLVINLPPPGTSTLGGIYASACSGGNVVSGYDSTGHPICVPGGGTGPGTTAWGAITGILSTQTDLFSALGAKAPLLSPALTGVPTAPTPLTNDSSTKIATTQYVQAQAYATINSPNLTGVPTAPTPATVDSSTKLATTAWVNAQGYGLSTGNVQGPVSSTVNNIALFNAVDGKTIKDAGFGFPLARANIGTLAAGFNGLAASATTDTTNASNITVGTLPAAQLPNPSSTTLGGVRSIAAVSHQWINTISPSGIPALSQPACGDLSNAAPSCLTDTTNAANISSGTLAIARGGLGGGTAPTSAQIGIANAGGTAYVPQTLTQDLSISNTGVVTVTRTGNVPFAASATTDATNAANISSGFLPLARLHTQGTGGTNLLTASTISGTGAAICTDSGGSATTVSCPSGGNISNSGTPTVTQMAQWVDSTHIQGIAVTGSGNAVLATSPTLVTPVLGVATATTVNKYNFTPPATGVTFTILDNKTFAVNNSLTLAGTDGTTQTFPTTSGTVVSSVTSATGDLGGTYPAPTVNAINLAAAGHGGVTGLLGTSNGGLGAGTSPTSAQVPVANVGGTAYIPKTISGDSSLANTGAATNVASSDFNKEIVINTPGINTYTTLAGALSAAATGGRSSVHYVLPHEVINLDPFNDATGGNGYSGYELHLDKGTIATSWPLVLPSSVQVFNTARGNENEWNSGSGCPVAGGGNCTGTEWAACNTGTPFTGANSMGCSANFPGAFISSIVRNGSNSVTVTTIAAHNYTSAMAAAGDIPLIITNVTGGTTSFDGVFTLASVPSSNTLTYSQTGSAESGTTDSTSQIGSPVISYASTGNSFGTKWKGGGITCAGIPGCWIMLNQHAQEHSVFDDVTATGWQGGCLYVQGAQSQNFFMGDEGGVECLGGSLVGGQQGVPPFAVGVYWQVTAPSRGFGKITINPRGNATQAPIETCFEYVGTLGGTFDVSHCENANNIAQLDTLGGITGNKDLILQTLNVAGSFQSGIPTAISRNGSNVVSATFAKPHGAITGETTVIAGVTGGATSFNGTFANVTVVDSTHYTYAQTGPAESGGVAGSPTATLSGMAAVKICKPGSAYPTCNGGGSSSTNTIVEGMRVISPSLMLNVIDDETVGASGRQISPAQWGGSYFQSYPDFGAAPTVGATLVGNSAGHYTPSTAFVDNAQSAGTGVTISGPISLTGAADQFYSSALPASAVACGSNATGFGSGTDGRLYSCDSGGNSGPLNANGGAIVKSASYTAVAGDAGLLFIMNCSSACAFTLPAAPPRADWNVRVMSIGSTLATISLNSLTYNGSASVPVLIKSMPLFVTTDGTNYRGDIPLVAGTNVTLTPASNGVTIAATGGSSNTYTYLNTKSYGGSGVPFTSGANTILLWSLEVDHTVTVNNISFNISTLDATNHYDVGIYGPNCTAGSSCALVSHVGAASYASTGTKNPAATGAPVTLNPGFYYIATTGDAATSQIGASNSNAFVINPLSTTTGTATTSTAGALPSSITLASAGATISVEPMPQIMFH